MARRSRLDIVVGANVRGALGGLRRVHGAIGGISRGIAKIGGIGGGLGFVGLIAGSIKAASTMEDLNLRMQAVSGSTKEAGKRFDETFEFFKRTPLNLKPLIDTRVLLEGVGVSGLKALNAVSEASVALGRNIIEVAQAVISLETESLRRLGITFARTADEGVFQFRDKFGKQITVQRKGIEGMRTALLKIFNIKFGGFLEKGALTFTGLRSTLGGLIVASLADLGGGLLTQAKRFVSFINAELTSGLESGFFKRMGEKIETAVLNAFDFAKLFGGAGFRGDIFENASKLFVANIKLGMIDVVRLITELDPFRIEALTRFIAQTDFGKKNLPGLGSARTRQFAEAELNAKRAGKEAKDNLGSLVSGVTGKNELSDIAAFRFGQTGIGGGLSHLGIQLAGRGRSRNVTERFTFRGGAAIVKLKEGDTLAKVMQELRDAILTRDINPAVVAQ